MPYVHPVRAVFALAFLFFLTLPAGLSAEPREVRVGVFPAAPLVMDGNPRPDGLFVELLELVAAERDWRISYVRKTWNELLGDLEAGRIDLLPAVGVTPERRAAYDYARTTVFVDSGVLFTGSRFPIQTVFDLEGRRVAGVEGSRFTAGFAEYVATFGVSCEIIPAKDNPKVMRMIEGGEVDAGVCIYSLGRELMKSHRVTITPVNFSPIALTFAAPKGRNGDLLAAIDDALVPMMHDPGSPYRRAMERWIDGDRGRPVPPWLLAAMAAVLGLAALSALWALTLRRQVEKKTRSLNAEVEEHRLAEVRALKAVAERDTLIRELHHRTKNTMQIMRSLVSLQSARQCGDGGFEPFARALEGRIDAIALVHGMLYESDDLSRVSLPDFVDRTLELAFGNHGACEGRVTVRREVDDFPIMLDVAVPLGIVLNELISNSINHAFPGDRRGTVSVRIRGEGEGSARFEFSDDGIGLPDGTSPGTGDSLGLSIVASVVADQLKGDLAIDRSGGTRYSFSFRTDLYASRV